MAHKWKITSQIIWQHKKSVILGTLLLGVLLFWLPWLIIYSSTKALIVHDSRDLSDYQYIIVFGGLVNPTEPLSETNRERLLAAKVLIDQNDDAKIIVSNDGPAADMMKNFLVDQGIDSNRIQVDAAAAVTTDTCRAAVENDLAEQTVVLISHGYHLPRLIYQCRKIGLVGVGFAAESITTSERTQLPLWQVVQIRTGRYMREAGLSWLAWLNIYQ